MTETQFRTASVWCKWISHLRMRMFSYAQRPLGLVLIPRQFTWGGHMAPHGALNAVFITHLRWAFKPVRRHLLCLGQCTRYQMAHSRSNSPDCFVDGHRPLSPLSSLCPGGSATGGERTATGRRCALYCCLETIPGFHYTHSNFCSIHFNSQAPPIFVDHLTPIIATPSRVWVDSSENFTMPRLRQ